MASGIVGRGDVVGLIERFEEVVDEEKAERDAIRMLNGEFDMNDFLEQIAVLKKVGPLKETVERIPGLSQALPEGKEVDDLELVRIGAMISSMTGDERRHPECFVVTSREGIGTLYDMSRLARVARGSGREEQEVTDLLDRFTTMRQLMKQIGMSTGLLG